jgi:hypothetical protein
MHEDPPRCAACGDVIGVYEPVVVVRSHAGTVESPEAEPAPPGGAEVRYHMTCWSATSRVGERAA